MNQQPLAFDLPALQRRIEFAEREATQACGLSDVLYEARVQHAYADILAGAPTAHRAITETALRSRGFAPDFVPNRVAAGECGLTGIEADCCPCGQHE